MNRILVSIDTIGLDDIWLNVWSWNTHQTVSLSRSSMADSIDWLTLVPDVCLLVDCNIDAACAAHLVFANWELAPPARDDDGLAQ